MLFSDILAEPFSRLMMLWTNIAIKFTMYWSVMNREPPIWQTGMREPVEKWA
jgi:hypothetical protein